MAEDKDDYRVGAAELYRLNVERLKIVQVIQADYGKWLIATLALIHTGALYAIATGELGKGIPGAYLPSLAGVILTLISGLFTWANFTLGIRLYENWTNPAMLSNVAYWPVSKGPLRFWIPATMAGALVTGIGAGACIIWEAVILGALGGSSAL